MFHIPRTYRNQNKQCSEEGRNKTGISKNNKSPFRWQDRGSFKGHKLAGPIVTEAERIEEPRPMSEVRLFARRIAGLRKSRACHQSACRSSIRSVTDHAKLHEERTNAFERVGRPKNENPKYTRSCSPDPSHRSRNSQLENTREHAQNR